MKQFISECWVWMLGSTMQIIGWYVFGSNAIFVCGVILWAIGFVAMIQLMGRRISK